MTRSKPHWMIEPGRAAGPLAIGMPIDAAAAALDAAGLGPASEDEGVLLSEHHAIRIQPGRGEAGSVVHEIELIRSDAEPLQAELFGHPLLGEPLTEVARFLFAVDARAERHAHQVEAPGLGVRVWSGGDPPTWPVASVSVSRPVPPARVIDSRFTFARLDRAAQTLGFTGGATTVRAPLVRGEPEVAEWSRRQVLIRYTFDPVTFLRVIRLDGPEATDAPVVQRLMAQIPVVTQERILADLESDDDETVLRAIQAVGVLRLTAARDRLRRLSQEMREPVHSAAISTLIGLPDVQDQE